MKETISIYSYIPFVRKYVRFDLILQRIKVIRFFNPNQSIDLGKYKIARKICEIFYDTVYHMK